MEKGGKGRKADSTQYAVWDSEGMCVMKTMEDESKFKQKHKWYDKQKT